MFIISSQTPTRPAFLLQTAASPPDRQTDRQTFISIKKKAPQSFLHRFQCKSDGSSRSYPSVGRSQKDRLQLFGRTSPSVDLQLVVVLVLWDERSKKGRRRFGRLTFPHRETTVAALIWLSGVPHFPEYPSSERQVVLSESLKTRGRGRSVQQREATVGKPSPAASKKVVSGRKTISRRLPPGGALPLQSNSRRRVSPSVAGRASPPSPSPPSPTAWTGPAPLLRIRWPRLLSVT